MFTYPKNISNFKLIKPFFLDYNHRSFKYAFYESENQKAFAKIWQGSKHNFDYKSLIDEINVYKAFDSIKSTNKIFFEKDSKIKIPKLIYYEIKHDSVVLLIEFVDGMGLKNQSEDVMVDVFISLSNFFRTLTKNLNKKLIKQRPIKLVPIYFLVYLIIVFVKYPNELLTLIKCIGILTVNLPKLLFSNEYSFVHKSLEGQNVILKDKHIYVIDFQLSGLSHPLLEFAQTFAFYPSISFVEKIYSKMNKYRLKNNSYNRGILTSLSIYTCIQQLALSDENVQQRLNLVRHLTCIK